MERLNRRLAAIMAADVAGYSRLVGADEDGTLRRLRALFREVVRPLVGAHGGRVFKLMGDAVLAEFPSAVEAVRCAVAVQEAVAAREDEALRLRIGVHLGDVVVEGSDLLGDGVNVAARLEGEARPGGIALSAAVAEAVRGRVPQVLEDLGERRLKNIERPVRVFAIGGADAAPAHPPLPDKPSLVVLPFQNMSGDAEQEYFADGMVEDITTALSRIRWLFVIARNSAFTFKGRAVDVRQVGRELGVRYVVEGSVRRAGGRVRITAQLVEAETGRHLWADRFDGDLAEVFALQDRVTDAVARALGPSLRGAEMERSRRKPPASLDAYDLYLRALPCHYAVTRDENEEALRLARTALEREPGYASAAALASLVLGYRHAQGWSADPPADLAEAVRLARHAVAADPLDPDALAMAARIIGYSGASVDEALSLAQRAVSLNANSALVLAQCAWVHQYAAHPDAVVMFERAARIDPFDPESYSRLAGLAIAHVIAGDADAAVAAARQSVAQRPDFTAGLRALAAALALAGDLVEARSVIEKLRRLQPELTLSRFDAIWRSKPGRRRYYESLIAAGLPE